MPSAAQFAGLVPGLLDLGVILNDNGVLKEKATVRVDILIVEGALCVSTGATGVDGNIKENILTARIWW